jgi:O-antigen/teichoic acid export membrane protein
MLNFRSERFHRLSKEAFWIIFGQAIAVVGSLVGIRLITGLLNPNEYGDLALGMTFAMLINQLVLGPLSNGITRFYAPAFEQDDLHGYLKAVRRLLFGATGAIVLILILFVIALIVVKRTEWIFIAIASIIFALLSGYNSILSGIQNAARQRSVVALFQGLDSWTRFLVAAGLLIYLGSSSLVAMIGYVIASALIFGSQYLFFYKSFISKISIKEKDNSWQNKIWKFSWPFATYGILTWSQLASDRWALKLFTSSQEVGLYAALYQIGYYPMSLINNMIGQFLGPILYQRAGDASNNQRNNSVKKLIWKFTTLSLLLTGITFLLAILFHAQIFYILVNKKYGIISYLLPWMLFSGGVFAAGQILTTNLMINLKTKSLMVVKIITALLGIAFNFAGAYWFGIAGIVIASVLFSLSYFIWMVIEFYMDGHKSNISIKKSITT